MVQEVSHVNDEDARIALCKRAVVVIPLNCTSWAVNVQPHDYIDRFKYLANEKRQNKHFKRYIDQQSLAEILHFFEILLEKENYKDSSPIRYASWQTGDFEVDLEQDFSTVTLSIVGLQFDRIALENCLADGTDEEPKLTSAISKKRGGRPPSAAWPRWVAELVHYIHENGYPDGEGAQGQEMLINSVADRLAEQGFPSPSRSTVQRSIQAVLDRFRHG
ncbi:hypothetical protein GRI91_12545 [Altererythrobacter endophyticus]|uniref:Uncharacterized protein n=2 Tax=Altericroceibacterium endophyticum TaxID=1808508 RepID=A0A6I4T6X5_9SPHN|nr:hypothetical protein [Altericroceibacterium endophyticum]